MNLNHSIINKSSAETGKGILSQDILVAENGLNSNSNESFFKILQQPKDYQLGKGKSVTKKQKYANKTVDNGPPIKEPKLNILKFDLKDEDLI